MFLFFFVFFEENEEYIVDVEYIVFVLSLSILKWSMNLYLLVWMQGNWF